MKRSITEALNHTLSPDAFGCLKFWFTENSSLLDDVIGLKPIRHCWFSHGVSKRQNWSCLVIFNATSIQQRVAGRWQTVCCFAVMVGTNGGLLDS